MNFLKMTLLPYLATERLTRIVAEQRVDLLNFVKNLLTSEKKESVSEVLPFKHK